MTINNNTLSGRVISTISTLGAALTGRRVQVSTGTSSIPESLKGLKVVFQETLESSLRGDDRVFPRAFFKACGFIDNRTLDRLSNMRNHENFLDLDKEQLKGWLRLEIREEQALVNFMCALGVKENREAFVQFLSPKALEALIERARQRLSEGNPEKTDTVGLYRMAVIRISILLGTLHHALFCIFDDNKGLQKSSTEFLYGFILIDILHNKIGVYGDAWDIALDALGRRKRTRRNDNIEDFVPYLFNEADDQWRSKVRKTAGVLRQRVERGYKGKETAQNEGVRTLVVWYTNSVSGEALRDRYKGFLPVSEQAYVAGVFNLFS